MPVAIRPPPSPVTISGWVVFFFFCMTHVGLSLQVCASLEMVWFTSCKEKDKKCYSLLPLLPRYFFLKIKVKGVKLSKSCFGSNLIEIDPIYLKHTPECSKSTGRYARSASLCRLSRLCLFQCCQKLVREVYQIQCRLVQMFCNSKQFGLT